MGRTTFGFDAADPDETRDSGRAEKGTGPGIESSHEDSPAEAARRVKLTWSRGHTVSKQLSWGYDVLMALWTREVARHDKSDRDENLDDQARCDPERID
jgi:hypothetical protein